MKRLLFLAIPLVFLACSDDQSEPSTEFEMLEFSVDGTDSFPIDVVSFNQEYQSIHALSPVTFDDQFPVQLTPSIVVSPGATVSPASGETVTINTEDDFIAYTVTSETGLLSRQYFFTVRDKQLSNSTFDDWFEIRGMNAQFFEQPGVHEGSTIWATANMATSAYSVYGTTPEIDGSNTRIRIETIATSPVPVASGTLFLGKFDLQGAIDNPTEPEAAVDYGIPFIYTPSAIRLNYSYVSGDNLIQATLKESDNIFGGFTIEELSGKDNYKIEAALERREGENITTIATALIESDIEVLTLSELELTLDYQSTETPTHFYISFASSAEGHYYKGAVGSTLIVDDIELVYD
ncbi:MAG: PCMD domain-containing protein [Reichenbachiella sp.]